VVGARSMGRVAASRECGPVAARYYPTPLLVFKAAVLRAAISIVIRPLARARVVHHLMQCLLHRVKQPCRPLFVVFTLRSV